jgi:hypothetical protein
MFPNIGSMAVHCTSYEPGHLTSKDIARKVIRAAKSAIPCQVVEVRPDGTVVLDVEGDLITLWHHKPQSIESLLVSEGHEASYDPALLSLLVRPVMPHAGRHGFRIAAEATHSPCVLADG